MNMNEVIEQEQLERDRKRLMGEPMKIEDVEWEFITDLILQSNDKKISEHDVDLINSFTKKIKKELGL